MSFLDPDNLPLLLIEATLSTETADRFKQLAPLLNFGLLTRQGPSSYRLHLLVSMWTRVKMDHNIAGVFRDEGEYDKALEWYQRALDGQEKAPGKDHPNTIRTVQNMAALSNRSNHRVSHAKLR